MILRKFKNNSVGAAVIEFAIVLPTLLAMLFGLNESYNFISLNTKLNEIAAQVGALSAANPTEANVKDILIGTWLMGQDYDFANKGGLTVTGINTNSSGKPRIVWQHKTGNAYTSITTQGAKKIDGAAFTLADSANIVAVEINYDYKPFFKYGNFFPSAKLYRVHQSLPGISLSNGNSDDDDYDDDGGGGSGHGGGGGCGSH